MAFDSTKFTRIYAGSAGFPQHFLYQAVDDAFATVAAASYFSSLSNIVRTGDKLTCNTETSGLSFSGTFLNVSGTVSVNWDNTLRFTAQMNDISAAETIYTAVPPAGVITQVFGVQYSAITVASSIITFSLGGVAITGGTLTVTTAGTAGTAYSATPTAANTTSGSVAVGIASDGGGSTTARGIFGVKVICPAQI